MLKKYLPSWGIIIFLLIFVPGCANLNQQPPRSASNKIQIVTTIFPFYEFAREIGQDQVEVLLLLPPGADPHTFEPTPTNLIKITHADVFIYTGAGLEPWAHDLLTGVNSDRLTIIEGNSLVDLIPIAPDHHLEDYHEIKPARHEHGDFDPHFWLDFENDQKVVTKLSEILGNLKPEQTAFFIKNAQDYIAKLQHLDQEYRQTLSSCRINTVLTGGHQAYNYLGYRYNLNFISAYGLSPDSEPTPQHLKEMVDLSKTHQIKYILFEQLVSPRLANTIATEGDLTPLVFNPGANLIKEEFEGGTTFISLMTENLKTLTQALECYE
jgi:zinc transport system substrate-binding protein